MLVDLRWGDYDVVYLGYNADGHIGRLNPDCLRVRCARARPEQLLHQPPRADQGVFRQRPNSSYDHDWMRFRLSALYASGDKHLYDNTETGFDAILENPVFAGADTSY